MIAHRVVWIFVALAIFVMGIQQAAQSHPGWAIVAFLVGGLAMSEGVHSEEY
jgi:hypothetical protein